MKYTLTILEMEGVDFCENKIIGSKLWCNICLLFHRIMYGKKLAKKGVTVKNYIEETRLKDIFFIYKQKGI